MSNDSNSPFDFDRALKEMAHSYADAKWPANNTKPVVSQEENNINDVPLDTVKWNGEKLPPAGTVCERQYAGGDPDYWIGCKVVFSDERRGVAVVEDDDGDDELWVHDEGMQRIMNFRPIRTQEEVEREEWIEAAMDEYQKESSVSARAAIARIYDAGLAGYRKQGDKS